MDILVINAGSSSLKYQLIDMTNEEVKAKGLAERIGIEGSNLKHQPLGKQKVIIEKTMETHTDAITMVLDALLNEEYGVIKSMDEISAVGHRVLHGGAEFSGSVLIDDDVMDAVRRNIPLGPLHNPANLMGIEACIKNMPGLPQVAVFDTAFHQTMPKKAYLYGIPYEYYEKYKIRRYGFHGTSHRFIARKAAKVMGKKPEEIKVITCHLGNGGSLAAVDCGKCVDTSMGLTPLEGILMGTRSGDVDPTVVEYLMNNEGMDVGEVIDLLNKKSGLLGVSGISSDMRDITAAMDEGNEKAITTYNIFVYRIVKYIGAYVAAMNGVDCIVITAGIGENNPDLRRDILKNFEYLGLKFDDERNKQKGDSYEITAEGSAVRAFTIATNEELMIARDTYEIVGA
jgi:acetate kinase